MPPRKKSKKSSNNVPFVKGFIPPDEQSIHDALGSFPLILKSRSIPLEDPLNDRKLFSRTNHLPLPSCNHPQDWLAVYREEGQTFDQFREFVTLRSGRYKSSANASKHTIHLVPIGDFDAEVLDLSKIISYTEAFYQRKVQVLEPIQILPPKKNPNRLTLEDFVGESYVKYRTNNEGRRQLDVEDVLSALAESKASKAFQTKYPDCFCLMAVTMEDLFQSKEDLFIAGLAAGASKVAAFSFFRYQPGLVTVKSNWDKYYFRKVAQKKQQEWTIEFLRRCLKLIVHELGHLFGIDHCIFYFCIMNGSGHLEEDWKAPLQICPVDLRKLQFRLGFDIFERYRQLKRFCEEWGLIAESNWFSHKLTLLGCTLSKNRTQALGSGEGNLLSPRGKQINSSASPRLKKQDSPQQVASKQKRKNCDTSPRSNALDDLLSTTMCEAIDDESCSSGSEFLYEEVF